MAEVAIVGAGPVGLVAALELIQRGIDTVVLERRGEPATRSRSIGVHPPALEILDRLGCGTALVESGLRIADGEVRFEGAVLGGLSFREASARHPYVLSVPQQVTERVLRARLTELAPDALLPACEVTGAAQTGTGVRLETTGGPVAAAWAIGADGSHSAMRERGGFTMRTRVYPDRYAMGDAPDGTGLGARAAIHLERDGVVESFPMPGGLRRWVVHRGSDPAALDAGAFARIVRERTGAVLDARSVTGSSAFGVRHAWATRSVRGRMILAGDAAHEISPIGGQGMTLGLLDAVELAATLSAVLAGAGANGWAAYERAASRRQRIAARQAFFNTAMGRPRRGIALEARNLAVRALSAPAFERRLAAAFTMAAPARVLASREG